MKKDDYISELMKITEKEYLNLSKQYREDRDAPLTIQLVVSEFRFNPNTNVAIMYLLDYVEKQLDAYETNRQGLERKLKNAIEIINKKIANEKKNAT